MVLDNAFQLNSMVLLFDVCEKERERERERERKRERERAVQSAKGECQAVAKRTKFEAYYGGNKSKCKSMLFC